MKVPPELTARVRLLSRSVDELRRAVEPPPKWPRRAAIAGALLAVGGAVAGVALLTAGTSPAPIATHDAGTPDGGSTMIAVEPVWRASLLAAECTHTGEYNALCEAVAPPSGAP